MDDAVAFVKGECGGWSNASEVDEDDAAGGGFDDAVSGDTGARIDANDTLAFGHELFSNKLLRGRVEGVRGAEKRSRGS